MSGQPCGAAWSTHEPPLTCDQPADHRDSVHYDGEQDWAFAPEDAGTQGAWRPAAGAAGGGRR